ncbi:MAG: hypothetical protein E7667_03985 [Ruminococcaceae bacterium]|nr:hypothetical protein [Oscillospiraceae bacterium]
MKKFNKIISLLLTVVMLMGSLSVLMTIDAFAAEASESQNTNGTTGTTGTTTNSSKKKPSDYTEKVYLSADEKIASMRRAFSNHGFDIYVDDYSGEVAVVNQTTGEKLFTNPWDVAADKSSNTTTDDSTVGSIKEQLLSQIELSFTDLTGTQYTYNSFRMAASKDQITVKNIKNGIRVEYTIGREQAKMLVPMHIEKSRFDQLIKTPITDALKTIDKFNYEKFLVYFTPVSLYEIDLEGNLKLDESGNKIPKDNLTYNQIKADFPASTKIDVMYVIDGEVTKASERAWLEQMIKTYCPDYTYEELEYDHEMTEYESEEENPPVFKMALEYTLDEKGVVVRLPANGMRFNESLFTLNSLTVLPYMGAGSNWADEGYNFMPDGSGALYEFDSHDVTKTPVSVYNHIYGTDYAYHEISGTYEKVIRYPVFGTVEKGTEYTYTYNDKTLVVDGVIMDKVFAEEGMHEDDMKYFKLREALGAFYTNGKITKTTTKKSGFLAIIEEGDALTKIASYHGGNQNDYNSVKMQFTPRPSDTYSLDESMSVSGLGEWTVVSERKYLGNYKIRYVMLSDADAAAEQGIEVYDASWLGMAAAYRDYLYSDENSVLAPLAEKDLTDDIPLYIESFGAMETVERILSVPITKMTALTTFEDIKAMYDELSTLDADEAPAIKNINFKLTGFANGGMYYTVPKKLKFERVVGGNKGFQELLDYAKQVSGKENSNLGIFPDFDFSYVVNESTFDGVSLNKHAARTIDDRYASKRVYSASQQKYINYYDLVISPAYFSEFYEKLIDKYLDYDNINGISVGSLGNSLNSDFDEDEPYNREDAKEFTIQAFKYIDSKLPNVDIMTSGGNSYTWKYVDHILDVALDSSRQSRSSNSVPFIGVVLHGSVQFAGEPLNMEGDLQYALLKAIENGASPYFVLSYRNTENLKEDEYLSKYYSIRYDIWKDDLVSTYTKLNSVLSDVQDKYIINHEFWGEAERVPDMDEVEADIIGAIEDYIEYHKNELEYIQQEIARALINAREEGRHAEEYIFNTIDSAIEGYSAVLSSYETLNAQIEAIENATTDEEKQKAKNAFVAAISDASGKGYKILTDVTEQMQEYLTSVPEALETIKQNTTDEYMIAEAARRAELVMDYYENSRFVLTSPANAELGNRKLTLVAQEDWCDGKPTYIYGLENGQYLYAVGDNNRGYSFYTCDANGTYKAASKESIAGDMLFLLADENRKVEGVSVYHNGNKVDGYNIYKYEEVDGDGEIIKEIYYSIINGYAVYYQYQASYSDMAALAEMYMNTILEVKAAAEASGDSTFVRDISNQMTIVFKDDKDEETDDEEEEFSRYAVDNIVVVTYGTGNEAYKYVILNYNDFTVKVTYNGVTYTIPGYDFVDVKA